MNRELTVKVNVVTGRNDNIQLKSTGDPRSNSAYQPVAAFPPNESLRTSPIIRREIDQQRADELYLRATGGFRDNQAFRNPLISAARFAEFSGSPPPLSGNRFQSSTGFSGFGLSSTGTPESNFAAKSLQFYQSAATDAAYERMVQSVGTYDHARAAQQQAAREEEARRYGVSDSAISYNQSPSQANLARLVSQVNAAVQSANPLTNDRRDWIERQQEVTALEANAKYRFAKMDADMNPTTANKNTLLSTLQGLREQYAPGTPEYQRTIREEIDIRKQLIRTANEESRQRLIAEKGRFLGNTAWAQQMSGPTMGQVGMYAGMGQASILGAVSAGSPDMMSTYLKSWQLLSGEIGISFIPAMARASQLIQSTARWIRDLDDGTKTNAANFAFWGTAIGLGVVGLSKLVNVGLGLVETFGRVRASAIVATDAIIRMQNTRAAWPTGMNPVGPLNPPTNATGIGAWLRQNPATVGGVAGFGMSTYGMMNPENPYSPLLTMGGNALMLSSYFTPQAAGWSGMLGRAGVAGMGLYAGYEIGNAYGLWGTNLPRGELSSPESQQAYERARRSLTERETFWTRFESGLLFGDAGQSRLNALQNTFAGSGVDFQRLGINASTLQGGLGTGMLGQSRINEIARGIGVAIQANEEERGPRNFLTPAGHFVGPVIPGSQQDIQSQLNFNQAERNRLLWSTSFQPQQVPIESLKGMIQNEIIRSPQDQELMAQQMRALESLTRTIERLNSNLQQTAPQNAAIP